MKICMVGGGNIGTAMCSYIKNNDEHTLVVKTSNPSRWSNHILYIDKETGVQNEFDIDLITNNPKEAFEDTDLIFITLPSFMIEDAVNEMKPYLKKGCMVGVVPGSGGCEFYCKELIDSGIIFFGLDRVPCVSRLAIYGHKVVASKKEKTRAVAIPANETENVCNVISQVLHMQIDSLNNYLTVTFTPSNPIVHTTRLYSMFNNITKDTTLDSQIYFYGEWDDFASETMIGADDDLHRICDALTELDLTGVIPLLQHYEQNSIETLTAKIRSIESMKEILSPLKEIEDGKFKIDLKSRYFVEDWPFGLCILKGFAIIVGVETPYMDKVLKWYEQLGDKEYFVNGKFEGKDLKNCAIPQNFGINTIEDVYRFYK